MIVQYCHICEKDFEELSTHFNEVHEAGRKWNILYKLGKDLKIKNIDCLSEMPCDIIYHTNRIERITASGNGNVVISDTYLSDVFTKISVSSQHLEEASNY